MKTADPGGVFASDDHRRVLGHLAPPGDEKTYSAVELHARMLPDVASDLDDKAVARILADLAGDGLAEPEGDQWQMTELGFERITYSPPDEEQQPGPAAINEGADA